MYTEVSSSLPHFLQAGSLLSPIICRCLLRVLCPVSRPTTTLICVLLKDSNRVPVARLGPEINSRACLCVLQGPRHNARCWFFKNARYSRPILRNFQYSLQSFRKFYVKIHENPFCGTRGVSCGQTDMKKLIFPYRNIAKEPIKNERVL